MACEEQAAIVLRWRRVLWFLLVCAYTLHAAAASSLNTTSPVLAAAQPNRTEIRGEEACAHALPSREIVDSGPRLVVHLFAFNRPSKFAKLWESLQQAERTRIPCSIVVHVDCDAERSSEWQQQVTAALALKSNDSIHGPVSVILAARPKGLRVTMLEAWAPREGEYAMFLEDDIEVSPLIFLYAERFILAYGEVAQPDPRILGYKLYNQKWDEVNQRMETPVNNQNQPFLIQEPCSWGTVFVAGPYRKYMEWYVYHSHLDPLTPHAWSNTWDPDRSAKKYLQRYMWEQGLFLVAINLPNRLSLTTPRVDSAGTNMKERWLDFLRERLEVPLLTTGM